uniref:Uncharacterized protein n=1 Tax=Zea mays TaxID=4577 RepID=C0HEB2_MAIZE|nr:unknown [Zea mays]
MLPFCPDILSCMLVHVFFCMPHNLITVDAMTTFNLLLLSIRSLEESCRAAPAVLRFGLFVCIAIRRIGDTSKWLFSIKHQRLACDNGTK